MAEQSTVTIGTAVSGAAGAGATVAVGAETVQWLYQMAIQDKWLDMPVATAALIGALATGALSLAIWLLYWWLAQRGIKPPRQMFPARQEEPK
jgi:uncharacterized BrkB/YihY/UPF0761 family membrane protein